MKNALASFRDCVVDAVMAAAGAFGTARLSEVFEMLAHRRVHYFDDEGNVKVITGGHSDRRLARNELFLSEAFQTVTEDGVISFKVCDTYCAEVFRYNDAVAGGDTPSASVLETVHSIGSVLETVGSIRTLDSHVLSAVVHAPVPSHDPAPLVANGAAYPSAAAAAEGCNGGDCFDEDIPL